MTFGRRILALGIALCLVLTICPSAFAEGAPIAAGAFRKGAYASEGTGTVYFAVSDASAQLTNLYSVPSAGGAMTLVETAASIKDLIAVDASLYYLRSVSGSWQLVRRTGANLVILQVFASAAEIDGLGYYDGKLYVISNGWLFSFDAQTGAETLVSEQMLSEYYILGGRIYYVSTEDERTYSSIVASTNTTLQVKGGCLYSMALTGGDVKQALEIGVADLCGYGEYLYFHNYADNYAAGSTTTNDIWLNGKLYRYSIVTGALSSCRLDYDWGFYPSQYGLLSYTMQSLSLVNLDAAIANPDTVNANAIAAASTLLMAPEVYTSVAVDGDFAFVYEHTAKSLTRLPLNGEVSAILTEGLSAGNAPLTNETVGQYVDPASGAITTTPTAAPATTAKPAAQATKKPAATSSTSKSGYLFPESSTRKLTTADLKKVDATLWAYGRNEIYAKHGYKFSKSAYADYFAQKSWYKAGGFSTKDLNSIEWYNMSFIKKYEDLYKEEISAMKAGTFSPSATKKPTVTPTDSSYIFPNSSTALLTEADVRSIDRSLWGYARNEIYARHGYQFNNAAYAKYFANKTWYKAGGFSTKDLNDIEWANMDLIKKLEASK